jgi:hypothetical protein
MLPDVRGARSHRTILPRIACIGSCAPSTSAARSSSASSKQSGCATTRGRHDAPTDGSVRLRSLRCRAGALCSPTHHLLTRRGNNAPQASVQDGGGRRQARRVRDCPLQRKVFLQGAPLCCRRAWSATVPSPSLVRIHLAHRAHSSRHPTRNMASGEVSAAAGPRLWARQAVLQWSERARPFRRQRSCQVPVKPPRAARCSRAGGIRFETLFAARTCKRRISQRSS